MGDFVQSDECLYSSFPILNGRGEGEEIGGAGKGCLVKAVGEKAAERGDGAWRQGMVAGSRSCVRRGGGTGGWISPGKWLPERGKE